MNETVNTIATKTHPLGGLGEALYFIGIGGIGMSAIARYFHARGVQVSGYDKTSTDLTRQLENEGISIHYKENIELVPKEAGMVVYTPAIPGNNSELQFCKDNNYKVVKRSDILKIITEKSFNICIAGTHGKTTVSTMIAHILRHTEYGCNAFLGGISANYGTNFWSSETNVCVIEADEYDRSFLKLSPNIAVVTAVDPDHLDIYGTKEEFEKAFVEFAGKVKPNGCLLIKKELAVEDKLKVESQNQKGGEAGIESNGKKETETLTYSLSSSDADIYTSNINAKNGAYTFDVAGNEWKMENVTLHIGGLHNIENMTAAIAVAKYLGIDEEKIKAAVSDFKGVKRRFEYVLNNDRHVLIDDYAHHPEELKALISGVRDLFNKKLVIVFQPHLYSRTKDQADGFAEVFELADEVILLPIYPAREQPMADVSSEMIAGKMKNKNVTVLSKETFIDQVKNNKPELLVMAGAGDIDVLVKQVKEILEQY